MFIKKYIINIYIICLLKLRSSASGTNGAGDTFISALCVNYLATSNIHTAIKFANECATTVVQLKGVNTIK